MYCSWQGLIKYQIKLKLWNVKVQRLLENAAGYHSRFLKSGSCYDPLWVYAAVEDLKFMGGNPGSSCKSNSDI